MIYMSYATDNSIVNKNFKNLLNPLQLKKYKNITNERLNIYYIGYLIGFCISFLFILFNKYYLNKKLSNISIASITGGITFLTSYFYYILSKKSDYMILHLNSIDQKKEWLKIYKTMQFNYHFGLVLGIISVMLMSISFC